VGSPMARGWWNPRPLEFRASRQALQGSDGWRLPLFRFWVPLGRARPAKFGPGLMRPPRGRRQWRGIAYPPWHRTGCASELAILWKREDAGRVSINRKWVNESEGTAYPAARWPHRHRRHLSVVDTAHCQYCVGLPIERAAHPTSPSAEGRRGRLPPRDYLPTPAASRGALHIHESPTSRTCGTGSRPLRWTIRPFRRCGGPRRSVAGEA